MQWGLMHNKEGQRANKGNLFIYSIQTNFSLNKSNYYIFQNAQNKAQTSCCWKAATRNEQKQLGSDNKFLVPRDDTGNHVTSSVRSRVTLVTRYCVSRVTLVTRYFVSRDRWCKCVTCFLSILTKCVLLGVSIGIRNLGLIL